MMHLTTELVCPYCSYRFAVCVHADSLPDPATVYTVCCPMNASKLHFNAEMLRPVETCPPGAVSPVEARSPGVPQNPESLPARRWWRFWS
jgi:hypothetical protein